MNLAKKIILSIVLVTAIFLIKSNVLNQPFFWDDMGGIIAPALDMFDHNFRLIHPYRNFGHPPLLHICLALVWKIFSYSIISTHIFIILLGITGLYYTFKIGRVFFNFWVGIGSAVLLFFNQIFFAQIGLANDSIPLLTLGVITVYCYSKNKKFSTFLFGSLLVLTKETGAFLIFAIFVHWLVTELAIRQYLPHQKKIDFSIKKFLKDAIVITKKSWFLTGTIGFLTAWFIFQKIQLGWFLRTDLISHQNDFWTNLNINFISHFVYDFTNRNVNKFNFIPLFFIVIAIAKYKTKILKKYSLFLLIIFSYLILFSFTDDLARYFTVILPFFYIISSHAIYSTFQKIKFVNIFFALTILLCSSLFISNYHGVRTGVGFELESNMEYSDLIYINQQATNYIEKKYPDSTIVTYWPMADQLFEPRFGYVTKRINNLVDVTWDNRDQYVLESDIFDLDSIQANNQAIFYITVPINKILGDISRNKEINILKTFEKNNKTSIIFKIDNK